MASPTSVLRTRVRDHEPLPSETSGTADMASPTSVLRTRIASVLAAFSDSPEQSHARSQALSLESDAQSQVLPSESHVQSTVLLSESNAEAEPPPQKKQRLQQQLVTGSLGIRMLPRCVPLPAARGGINKVCEIGKTTQKTNIHGLQACVERRKTPPTKVCTTLRVSTQSSKNIFWAEVKAAESLAHEQIIRDIASAIMKGDISSKEAAQEMKEKLLRGSRSKLKP